MTREEAIVRIKPHEGELRAAGMAALYLFGSTARGEAGPASDVDLTCDLVADRPIGLLDLIEMQYMLEDAVGTRIDLVERSAMRDRVVQSAFGDMVQIF